MSNLKANGLSLKRADSAEEIFEGIKSLEEGLAKLSPDASFDLLAYLDYRVLTGTYTTGQPPGFQFPKKDDTLEDKYIQKIRIFNENEELLLWRAEGGFNGRLRRDDDTGNSNAFVEANQIVFGTQSEKLAKFTRLWEERGTEFFVPGDLPVDTEKISLQQRVAIQTRNYIGHIGESGGTGLEPAQATYIDCRFVKFVLLED